MSVKSDIYALVRKLHMLRTIPTQSWSQNSSGGTPNLMTSSSICRTALATSDAWTSHSSAWQGKWEEADPD